MNTVYDPPEVTSYDALILVPY